MKERDRLRRRAIFDEVAAEYDAIRPGYPEAVIEKVIAWSRIPANGRILEVGCGTGQATLPFAQRGYRMTCLEPGPALAARARDRLAPYRHVQVLAIPFEEQAIQSPGFDLVICAGTFHWLDTEDRCARLARHLVASGALAVMANTHPRPYAGFFARVQAVYREVVPEWGSPAEDSTTDDLMAAAAQELRESRVFTEVADWSLDWQMRYSRDEHIALLGTYSDHRLLPPAPRRRLFAGIAALIDREYGGYVTRPYRTVLALAVLDAEAEEILERTEEEEKQ